MFSSFTSYQRRVLVLMMLVNFINYVDRQVVFPLFPLVRREFHLSYSQLGSLATAFTVVLSVGSLPLGLIADRTSRKGVICAGVVFWSLATFFSGLAHSFRALLAARALVGVGEAAYYPAGTATITATFSRDLRARVQGCFDIGMFAGGAVGVALGGILAQSLGWRYAFFIVGLPGLLLAWTLGKLHEPPKLRKQEHVPLHRLLRVPAFLMVLVSGWFASFAGYSYVAWTAAVVQEFKGLSVREAGVTLGVVAVLSGLAGIVTGAALSDRMARWVPWGRVSIVPAGFLLSAPFILLALRTGSKLLFVGFFGLGVYFLSWYHGPVTATIHDLMPARAHATASGIYTFFVNLFAMALAPLTIGWIADHSNLLWAMRAAVLAQVVGGLLFLSVIYLIRTQGLHPESLAVYPVPETAVLPETPE